MSEDEKLKELQDLLSILETKEEIVEILKTIVPKQGSMVSTSITAKAER